MATPNTPSTASAADAFQNSALKASLDSISKKLSLQGTPTTRKNVGGLYGSGGSLPTTPAQIDGNLFPHPFQASATSSCSSSSSSSSCIFRERSRERKRDIGIVGQRVPILLLLVHLLILLSRYRPCNRLNQTSCSSFY